MKRVVLYDTTLRDGMQAEGISFSVRDKLGIAEKLDDLGMHYIEGGNPGSNPKDMAFFREARSLKLKRARLTVFGSTRRRGVSAGRDPGLAALLRAGTPVVTLFGKSWLLHVRDVLRVSRAENLRMIESSVRYIRKRGRKVVYDAEHFFDGYRDNASYCLDTLRCAVEGGAGCVVLCDTNGGTLPHEVERIVGEVVAAMRGCGASLGIHCHNDAGVAVANTLIGVSCGLTHVQGTMNGYGERCANADLTSVIPSLKLKMGANCISDARLAKLTEVSRYISEVANVVPDDRQPYVGVSAFAHKGGMHVDAVRKNPRTFEHVPPRAVGNRRRVLVSEVSGRSNVLYKAAQYGIDLSKDRSETKKILARLKELEHQGYQFEAADGSFKLMMRKALGKYRKFFDLEGFRVSVEKREDDRLISEATIKVRVKGIQEHTASEGDGPVNALDNALRKALQDFYPTLAEMHLSDFKVRVLDAKQGTAAKVRVLIESRDHDETWGTVGLSENIMEASWQALVDSVEYKLLKDSRILQDARRAKDARRLKSARRVKAARILQDSGRRGGKRKAKRR